MAMGVQRISWRFALCLWLLGVLGSVSAVTAVEVGEKALGSGHL